MIGRTLGHYRITAAIGAGGMGEVYRATDSKLSRDVALKVLPAEMAADPDRRERFQREARALAALDHPGIVSVFSVEEADGVHFLTMQLVEGETLDAVIAAGGLALSRFLEISVPLADAVSAAHERGIVHRDLKPGNVMVTPDGRVKVLDFGLAKLGGLDSNPDLSSSPTGSRANLTGEGQVFGTVAYMSPEQARGAAVDARSDVFSLGVVLYQMLTGERPFKGTTAVDMISSILRDTPPSITELRADLPPHLARVLRRCLEKVPRDRYQTSRDVYNELKEVRADAASASSAPVPRTVPRPVRADSDGGRSLRTDSGRTQAQAQAFWIAVLPFTHSGADPELGSFADGLAEDINAGLAKFPYLSVVSRNSTLRVQAQAPDALAAGEQLGARYVLKGGIRKGTSSLRVTVQLVDTQTGSHLWAETYNRDLKDSDIFAVQDGISGRVVATVADSYGVLVRSMTSMVQQKADEDLAPSEWLFQYFAYRQQLSSTAHTAMKDRLERAVKRDAGQADLWACLAQVYTDEHKFGFRTDPTSLDRALAAARRAVELDRANQPGMVSLAEAYFFRRDLAAFRPAAEQAMALNRLNTDALGILGLLIVHTGEFQRGAAIVRRAMELNPNHAGWFHFGPIWEHFHRGEYDRALEHAMQVNMPSWFWQPLVIAAISGQVGRPAEAAAAVRDLLALDPGFAAHARRDVEVWHFASGLLEPVLEGLRRGGLSVATVAAGEAVPPAVAGTSSSLSVPVSTSSSVSPAGEARSSSDVIRADEGFWIAVLPFRYGGGDANLATLAEGLTSDIVTGLSRFSYLRVIARSSTAKRADAEADVRSAGKDLGARYVMEGTLRQAAGKLRLAVQIVDTTSGAHLWAENYERDFRPEALFELQDDLVPRIVSTVADMNGALPRSLSEAVRGRAPEDLSPYEAVLRSFGYFERITPEELSTARSGLESAVRKAPDHADAWAMLALLCVQDHAQGFGLQADPLGSGATAARRAVDAAPAHHLAWFGLAQALFFQKEFESFRNAAERAVALNPMDGNSIAFLGELLTYAGFEERGMELAERAKQLNSSHPGWYWYADFYDAYRRGDDRRALRCVLKVNMHAHIGAHFMMAAAYGQLGETKAAGKALGDLLTLKPDFPSAVRGMAANWWNPEYCERLIDGLRKAGMEIAEDLGVSGPMSAPPPSDTKSGEVRARVGEGFWIAVLPFKRDDGNADLKALAQGLSEEVVAGLSRFSYLRVITSGSTQRDADHVLDLRQVGRELGARYVLSGSLRQVGARLRVAAQLVDAATGAQLWSETYERSFRSEEAFELQDDLVARIVSTVGDPHGILPHNMSESLRGRAPDQMTPYEAVLRSFGFGYRSTPEEHAAVRDALERAVQEAPGYADAWAMLAQVYAHEYAHELNLRPDPLGRALQAARRAADAAPSNAMAYDALAWVLFFRKERHAFRVAAEQAIALNPLSSPALAGLGTLTAYSGDWEKGCAMVERALQLNPRHPGWYRFALFADAYRKGDYRGAVNVALKLNLPDFFVTHEVLAAAYGQLGERDEAGKALRNLLRLKPDYPAMGREKLEKWFDAELVEHWMDGIRKAGLEIPAAKGAGETAGSSDTAVSTTVPPSSDMSPVKGQDSPSIVVLPFANLSPDADNEYFSDGLTEEIIADLSKVKALRVISRTSAMQLKGAKKDVRTIGQELNVRYVLEGGVRKAGTSLKITAQLIDAQTDAHLWSDKYSGTVDAVFEVQERVSREIVRALNVTLTSDEDRRLAERPIANARAFELYLQARQEVRRMGADALDRAAKLLEEAVAIEGETPPLLALMAWAKVTQVRVGIHRSAAPLDEAETQARALLAQAPDSSAGESLLGYIAYERGLQPEAVRHFQNALAREPNDSDALFYMGISYIAAGQNEEANATAKRIVASDPLAPLSWMLTGAADWFVGRFGESLLALQRGLELDPQNFVMRWTMGYTCAALGQVAEAARHGAVLQEMGPDVPYTRQLLSLVDGLEGRKESARERLASIDVGPLDAHSKFHLAESFGLAGDTDRALDVLERAVGQGFYPYRFIAEYCPFLSPLRPLPRFAAILAKAKERSDAFRERAEELGRPGSTSAAGNVSRVGA